jgi:hypothetical protein
VAGILQVETKADPIGSRVSALRSRLVATNHKTEDTSSKLESSYAVSFLPHVTVSRELRAPSSHSTANRTLSANKLTKLGARVFCFVIGSYLPRAVRRD